MIQVSLFYSDRVLEDGEKTFLGYRNLWRSGGVTPQSSGSGGSGGLSKKFDSQTDSTVRHGMESARVHCSKRIYGVFEKTLLGCRNL